MAELYNDRGAPGLIIYNAVMGAPDKLLSSSVEHLQMAYAVDVISAIVLTQVAAPAMRAGGSGTIMVTGGGFADNPIPALATVSLGKGSTQIRRRHAGSRFGAGWHPRGNIDDRGADRCGNRLRSREHRRALLGCRPLGRSLAGGVSLHRRIGLKLERPGRPQTVNPSRFRLKSTRRSDRPHQRQPALWTENTCSGAAVLLGTDLLELLQAGRHGLKHRIGPVDPCPAIT
jgi:hypothetical protein